jgi:hypothetical protein
VALVERAVTIIKTGKQTVERVWLVTDLTPDRADPAQLLALNRGHWCIENRLHWVRDVTFDEDRCQVRTRHGPRVLASLRNFIIGLCRRMVTSARTSIPSVLRYFAARPGKALSVLIG